METSATPARQSISPERPHLPDGYRIVLGEHLHDREGEAKATEHDMRQRLQQVFSTPTDLEGTYFPPLEAVQALRAYAQLAGEQTFNTHHIPLLVAVSEQSPHGRYPFGAELKEDEGVRVFHTVGGRKVSPLQLSEADAVRWVTKGVPKEEADETVRALMANPAAVNERKLPFETFPTDAMTVGVYDPAAKEWTAQTLPFGQVGMHPLETVLHYSGNTITGSVAVKNEDGQVTFLRLEEHIERAVRDAKQVGLPDLDPEFLKALVRDQLQADHRWVPNVNNPHGNRTYVRFTFFPSNVGPKLSGPNASFFLTTTPIGPYKVDPMEGRLRVKLMDMARPVPPQSAVIKAGVNYPDAVRAFVKIYEAGDHDALFVNGEKGVQEGASANVVAVYKKPDGTWLLVTPEPYEAMVLPGITMKSVMEIAEHLGFETEWRVLKREELLEADVIGLTGTAMHGVVQIGELVGLDGNTVFIHPENGNNPLDQIQKVFDDIYRGRGPTEFQHWMQPVTA